MVTGRVDYDDKVHKELLTVDDDRHFRSIGSYESHL